MLAHAITFAKYIQLQAFLYAHIQGLERWEAMALELLKKSTSHTVFTVICTKYTLFEREI